VTELTFENPFRAPGRWWRGNLHTHTTRSDGELSPDETAAAYRSLGYDFLAITDHGCVTGVSEVPEGLLLLPGVEHGTVEGDPPRAWHLVSVGMTPGVPPAGGDLATLHAWVREHAVFSWLAHPYWSNLSEDECASLDDVRTTEIYNAVCERCIDRGCSDSAWDYVLDSGVRMNAIAVDDAHTTGDFGRGWIMLRAGRLDRDAVYDALRRGCFYATTGPEIRDLVLDDDVLRVSTSPARSVRFLAGNLRGACTWATDAGPVDSAEYRFTGDERYVRVLVEDAAGRRAWTNPVYVEHNAGGD